LAGAYREEPLMQCTNSFSPAASDSSGGQWRGGSSAGSTARAERGAPMYCRHSSKGTSLGAVGEALAVWYTNVLRYRFWLSGTVWRPGETTAKRASSERLQRAARDRRSAVRREIHAEGEGEGERGAGAARGRTLSMRLMPMAFSSSLRAAWS